MWNSRGKYSEPWEIRHLSTRIGNARRNDFYIFKFIVNTNIEYLSGFDWYKSSRFDWNSID